MGEVAIQIIQPATIHAPPCHHSRSAAEEFGFRQVVIVRLHNELRAGSNGFEVADVLASVVPDRARPGKPQVAIERRANTEEPAALQRKAGRAPRVTRHDEVRAMFEAAVGQCS